MKQKLILLTQPALFTYIFVMNLIGCGDVKVVDAQSTFAKADPLNEIVAFSVDHDKLDNIGCLKINDVISETRVLLSDDDPQVFNNALRAHLAPLNYPVKKKCGNSIQLMVNEYKVHDLVVVSRLIIDIHGSVQDALRWAPLPGHAPSSSSRCRGILALPPLLPLRLLLSAAGRTPGRLRGGGGFLCPGARHCGSGS